MSVRMETNSAGVTANRPLETEGRAASEVAAAAPACRERDRKQKMPGNMAV